MDLVVGETEYRGLKLVARFGKPPYWVIRSKDSPADEPPYDMQAFADLCRAVAKRYKGKITGYQVWNEPNLDREWDYRTPNPAAYVKFLAACYSAIKSADPDAVVISAPLAPTGTDDKTAMTDERYLQGMFDAGLTNYYDVLGLNAPGYKSPPETAPDDPALQGNRWQAFRHVEDMRAIQVSRDGGSKQIALLEVGWTRDQRAKIVQNGKQIDNPYRWHAVTEKEQADYLMRAYEYAAAHWRPWVGLMVTIYMPDPNWTRNDEEYWWSLAEPGNSVQLYAAFFSLANMARYIDDKTIPAIDPGLNDYQPLPPWIPVTPTSNP
jgi:polysaccharide biosynthesis protein PslG